MTKTHPDYDKDCFKHCVRYHGWLPACKWYKEHKRNGGLKYFTLCAKQAIDVFMLEMEGLLQRDEEDRRLRGVIICEANEGDAREIFSLVRPPLAEAVIVGDLAEILNFQDTPETEGRSPDEDDTKLRVRRLLELKRKCLSLRAQFPFDVINFDPYGSLVDPALEDNKLHKAFCKIFELQSAAPSFLLLVTTPVQVHSRVRARFREDFAANATRYRPIKDALSSRHGTDDYDGINEDRRIALGVAKSIIIPCARNNGWRHEHKGIYVYERGRGQKMLSSVVLFRQGGRRDDQSGYVADIVRVIKDMPTHYGPNEVSEDGAAMAHLARVVAYREKVRADHRT